MPYLVIDHLWKRRRKMEKKILDAMKKAGKPVRPGDVAKMIGADGKEVSKVIKELKKQGKVSSPKNCFYEPA
jgi:Mn-dependent DtxR family transcriptional regulator